MKSIEQKNSLLPVLIFSVVVFATIPFVQYNAAIDPDLTPKFICFSVFSSAMFLFFLFRKNKSTINFRQPFFLMAGIYILISFFSIRESVNNGEALYELIQIAFPFIFLIIVTTIISSGENAVPAILKFQNLAVIIFSFFGAVQIYQLNEKSVDSDFFHSVNFAIASTLGNKNFYSETVLLLLPFSICGAFLLKKWWRAASIISTVLILCSLVVLQTISTLAALAIATGATLLFAFLMRKYFISKEKTKQVFIFSVAVFLFLCAGIFFFFRSPLSDSIKGKIKNIEQMTAVNSNTQIENGDSRNANSVYERVLLWKNSCKLFNEKPIAGIGLANWKIFYPKYGIGGAYYLNSGIMHFEHPHNEYLLMMAERGSIGLIAWLAINAVIIFYLIKIIKATSERKEKIIALAIIFGVISFGVISFFGFPMHRVYSSILLMIMFGIAISFYQRHFIPQINVSADKMKIVFAFCFLFCIYTAYVIAKRLNGEKNIKKAFIEQSKNHFDRMKTMVNQADSYYFRSDLTGTPLNWYRGFASNYIQQYDSALYYFKLAEKENPYHLQLLNDIGATLENKGIHDEAIIYLRRALAITPVYSDALLNMSVTYYNKGNIDSAYSIISSFTVINNVTYDKCIDAVLSAKANKLISADVEQKIANLLSGKMYFKDWIRNVNVNCKKNNTTFENELMIEANDLFR